MRKLTAVVAFASFFLSCESQKKPIMSTGTTVVKTKEMLVGQKSKADLLKNPYNLWFDANYDGYKTDASTINELKKHTSGVSIDIYMGTWCSDSQQHVPSFYKILDQLKFDYSKVTLVTLDRGKQTPDNLEKGKDIERVPTFIFYKDGKEIHRIVESPIESLEKDMLKILTGQAYKHAYEK